MDPGLDRGVPGHREHPGVPALFLSFAVADMWMVLAALATTVLVVKGDRRAAVAGAALGSAMLFFGLYALLYDLNTVGLLLQMSVDEMFGKAVTLYNIAVGIVLLVIAWRSEDRGDVR